MYDVKFVEGDRVILNDLYRKSFRIFHKTSELGIFVNYIRRSGLCRIKWDNKSQIKSISDIYIEKLSEANVNAAKEIIEVESNIELINS